MAGKRCAKSCRGSCARCTCNCSGIPPYREPRNATERKRIRARMKQIYGRGGHVRSSTAGVEAGNGR